MITFAGNLGLNRRSFLRVGAHSCDLGLNPPTFALLVKALAGNTAGECELIRGQVTPSPHCAVIARKVSKRTEVAIQSGTSCGMPERCGGRLRGRWIAASLSLLAMTMCKVVDGVGVRPGFRMRPLRLTLRTR
jgi:hypothetical protein